MVRLVVILSRINWFPVVVVHFIPFVNFFGIAALIATAIAWLFFVHVRVPRKNGIVTFIFRKVSGYKKRAATSRTVPYFEQSGHHDNESCDYSTSEIKMPRSFFWVIRPDCGEFGWSRTLWVRSWGHQPGPSLHGATFIRAVEGR